MLLLQMVLGSLIRPVLYFPASGATVNGPLIKLLSPPMQYYFSFFIVGCVVASTVALFEYRFQAILPENSAFKFSTRTRVIIFASLPCLPEEALSKSSTVFLEPENLKFVFIFCAIAWCQCVVEGFFYVISSIRKLNPYVKHECSDRTKQLQWSFLKALLIQECAPILIAYPLPALYVSFSCYTGYMNMDLNNIAVLILMSHGMLSGVAVILVNKPYRQFCCRLFHNKNFPRKCSVFVDVPNGLNIPSYYHLFSK
ncbi:unnamed protein product [Caenorhabditis auriculariae]|uniref:Serpentine Receptor, class H n=1 Tax=Caenorhabditis auriculariae TaxID=2777116 RepID=A0A8S1HVP4_9PELO|nr:unnamed protein product [Caenorhabditis auriculariae]